MNATTVAIIGGGFCGTVAAIRLLTATKHGVQSLPFGSRIVLIEPGRAGEGFAYRTGPDAWRLNVPAGRMSAFSERPDDFLAWARARDPRVVRGDFLPRAWYGDYLADRLDLAQRRCPRWLSFEQLRSRATGLQVGQRGARIRLADGTVLDADRVLLAVGNSPRSASLPGGIDADAHPWGLRWLEELPTYVPRVLLVGTGLTMIDMALAIAEQRPDARMLAISRHGLLPRPHEGGEAAPVSTCTSQRELMRGPLSRRLRAFREASASSGGDWRSAMQSLREAMPALWRAAPPELRRRFLRHLRAWWDVHRHRSPRATLARIESLRERKRLEVEAGRIVETRRIKDGIVVAWRPRGSERLREELVDAVVNVTGPDVNPSRSTCPLVQSLIEQGLCAPDALGLGWVTDAAGRLLNLRGEASEVLYYAGPWQRARDWEATAVPELRVHVARTTSAIAGSLATGAGSYIRRIAAPMFRRERAVF